MTWPPVFDGIGALVVSSALDPEQLVDKIDRHSGAGALSWIAPKLTGTDTGGDTEVRHAINVWRGLGLNVGGWIYNTDPGTDVNSLKPWMGDVDFVVYDVEAPYKEDETPGGYAKAAKLVALTPADWTVGVTSYGGWKYTIDFGAFSRARWSILAQCYDSFGPGDEQTYRSVYAPEGIHRLLRSLSLKPGESVYRPEGIDG